jgi:hypothetical protein
MTARRYPNEYDGDVFHTAMWAGERRMAKQEKVSSCCGEPDRDTGDCDVSYGDFGLCSGCKEHCEYVEEEDE